VTVDRSFGPGYVRERLRDDSLIATTSQPGRAPRVSVEFGLSVIIGLMVGALMLLALRGPA
jgi:hypothetical protein